MAIENHETVYICVDDTDDLTKSTSTGSIAEEIGRRVSDEFGAGVHMGITRHQLLLDERVPYTSHNSSMCFDIVLPAGSAARVDEIGWEVICERRAASSNPGLCVLAAPAEVGRADEIRETYRDLVGFGQRAKKDLVTVEEARDMAAQFPEVTLKGEGDTAQGMIGALAGVGLRIGGDDGRFRGKYDLTGSPDVTSDSVAGCADRFADKYDVEPLFTDPAGCALDPEERITLLSEAKAVLQGGRLTVLCKPDGDGGWLPYTKDDFNKGRKKKASCEFFELDPDEEERFHEKKKRTCGSCLYRRLTDDGYVCSAGHTVVK